MSNITEVLNNERNMTSFNRGVIASGFSDILDGEGPFTLFVPSDIAFSKLPNGAMIDLLKPANQSGLRSLLNHHVVDGVVDFAHFKDGDLLTARDGQILSISVDNNIVKVNGATIQNRDVSASNGIIHSLDKILTDEATTTA